MTFLWPFMLLLLLLLPVFAWLYVRAQARRARAAKVYGSLEVFRSPDGRSPGLRRHIPALYFLLGIAILFLGLARPQAVVALPRQEGTVILAFDVSGSMAADDLQPSRMQAAKTAAIEFVKKQPLSIQIGVVSFSDSGFPAQVPTGDSSLVLAAINRLSPQHGTSIANGILTALKAITAGDSLPPEIYSNLLLTPTPTPAPVPAGSNKSVVIILLSDGENNEMPDPLAAAQTAADRGVRIYTVGIGSPDGTTVHINGFSLHTQLDEATLKGIAQVTGGTYYNAQSTPQLLKIYDQLNSELVIKPEKTEMTALFAGAGILLLLVGGSFSLLWFSRLP